LIRADGRAFARQSNTPPNRGLTMLVKIEPKL
jgi:hypothetical protein